MRIHQGVRRKVYNSALKHPSNGFPMLRKLGPPVVVDVLARTANTRRVSTGVPCLLRETLIYSAWFPLGGYTQKARRAAVPIGFMGIATIGVHNRA